MTRKKLKIKKDVSQIFEQNTHLLVHPNFTSKPPTSTKFAEMSINFLPAFH